jgi:hypothetical protein
VYTLSLMGSNTTGDIIRACSVPLNVETLQLAERLLKDRGFEGVNVFHNVWELLEYPPIEEKDWALVGIEEVSDMYENIMLALSAGNIAQAKKRSNKLYRYFESLRRSSEELVEPLLSAEGITNLGDFRRKFKAGQVSRVALLAFCRNTISRAGFPYLQEIFLLTEDAELRREAQLAIQCLIRSWR